MDLFLSWWDVRSLAVAQVLESWLPRVLQVIDPWMSPDAAKGARWTNEIAFRLASAHVGLVCLTRDNLKSPWSLYEAGALSNKPPGKSVRSSWT